MELRHLRYFVAVAEEENVTRAAARLHVSQPPLSRQIRDLEEELGLQLFERKPQSLKLTNAGQIFLNEARAVLDRANEALRVAATLAGRINTEIHVGYAPSPTIEILPRALQRFDAENNGVRIRLHDLSTEEMIHGLKDKSLDLALTIRPSGSMAAGILFEPIRSYAACLALPPAHPLSTVPKITLRQVAAEPLVVYSKEEYPEYHAWIAKLFGKQRLSPSITEEHDSSTSLIASVEAGRGVALVQQGFECLSGPRLIIRTLQPPPTPFVIGAAWRKDSDCLSVNSFLTALRQDRDRPPEQGHSD